MLLSVATDAAPGIAREVETESALGFFNAIFTSISCVVIVLGQLASSLVLNYASHRADGSDEDSFEADATAADVMFVVISVAAVGGTCLMCLVADLHPSLPEAPSDHHARHTASDWEADSASAACPHASHRTRRLSGVGAVHVAGAAGAFSSAAPVFTTTTITVSSLRRAPSQLPSQLPSPPAPSPPTPASPRSPQRSGAAPHSASLPFTSVPSLPASCAHAEMMTPAARPHATGGTRYTPLEDADAGGAGGAVSAVSAGWGDVKWLFLDAFRLLRDPRMALLVPSNMAFGFVQGFQNATFSTDVVGRAVGVRNIGYVNCMSAGLGALASLPLGRLSDRSGRPAVMAVGFVAHFLAAVLLLSWDIPARDGTRWGQAWAVSLLTSSLLGVGNVVWNGAGNSAVFGEYFTAAPTAAFANLKVRSYTHTHTHTCIYYIYSIYIHTYARTHTTNACTRMRTRASPTRAHHKHTTNTPQTHADTPQTHGIMSFLAYIAIRC